MILLRLITIALCAACVVLLATFQPVRIAVMPARPPPPVQGACSLECARRLTVVDVAAVATMAQLFDALHLRTHERITAVNDRPLAGDVPGAVIAEIDPRPGSFLDLTVKSAWSERRVLVLLH
jgi:hypothetical protein